MKRMLSALIAAGALSVNAAVVIDFSGTRAGISKVSETALTLSNLGGEVSLSSSTPPAVPALSDGRNRFSAAGVSGEVGLKVSALSSFNPAEWNAGAGAEFYLGADKFPAWGVITPAGRTGYINDGEAIVFTVDLKKLSLPAGQVFVFKGIAFFSAAERTGDIWLKRAGGEAPLQISTSEAGLILNDGDRIAIVKGAREPLLQSIEFDVMAVAAAAMASTPVEDVRVGPGLRVATAGHSFHVWSSAQINDMAQSAGLTGHRVAGLSRIGGSTVLQHWDVEPEKNVIKKGLADGGIDVLTLSPIWLPDEGIENFALYAAQHSPDVRVTVQEYWLPNDSYPHDPPYPLQVRAGCDHNAATAEKLRAVHAPYFRDMDAVVRAVNAKAGRAVLFVAPAGQAVILLREKVIAGEVPGVKTQEELFRDAWGHALMEVQILASYCHFAVIYRQSPVGLPVPKVLDDYLKAKNLSPAQIEHVNRMLQEFAWQAVTEHPLSGITGAPVL